MPASSIPVQIKVLDERIHAFGGLPAYATPGAAAFDVVALARYPRKPDGKPDIAARARLLEPFDLAPGEMAYVGLGFAIHIADPNYAAHIIPRSSAGSALGLAMAHGVGLLDADYQGEVIAPVWNRNFPVADAPLAAVLTRSAPPAAGAVRVSPGDRIAQVYLAPVVRPDWRLVSEFGEQSRRGAGGFGSTS